MHDENGLLWCIWVKTAVQVLILDCQLCFLYFEASVLVNFKNLDNDLKIVIEKWVYMLTQWRLYCHYCAVKHTCKISTKNWKYKLPSMSYSDSPNSHFTVTFWYLELNIVVSVWNLIILLFKNRKPSGQMLVEPFENCDNPSV
jgi:hypothetical protein